MWFVDFEYHRPRVGELPRPICVSAYNPETEHHVRTWLWDGAPLQPPFTMDDSTIMVAYAAQAELLCFIALEWRLPANVIDLFAEFRRVTNGRRLPGTNGLLGALAHYGIAHEVDDTRKDAMRDLAIRGGPYTRQEYLDLMDYCDSDVEALHKLMKAMEKEGVI